MMGQSLRRTRAYSQLRDQVYPPHTVHHSSTATDMAFILHSSTDHVPEDTVLTEDLQSVRSEPDPSVYCEQPELLPEPLYLSKLTAFPERMLERPSSQKVRVFGRDRRNALRPDLTTISVSPLSAALEDGKEVFFSDNINWKPDKRRSQYSRTEFDSIDPADAVTAEYGSRLIGLQYHALDAAYDDFRNWSAHDRHDGYADGLFADRRDDVSPLIRSDQLGLAAGSGDSDHCRAVHSVASGNKRNVSCHSQSTSNSCGSLTAQPSGSDSSSDRSWASSFQRLSGNAHRNTGSQFKQGGWMRGKMKKVGQNLHRFGRVFRTSAHGVASNPTRT